MAANLDRIQQQMQTELEKFKSVQKDIQKLVGARQQLEAQLNENKVVQEFRELTEQIIDRNIAIKEDKVHNKTEK